MNLTEEIMNDAKKVYLFHASFSKEPVRSDLILAAGSHDLRVPEYAAHLFLQGWAPLIVCSGGFGKVTDGLFKEPEGVLFAQRCRQLGVPEEAILVEKEARNTGENFTLSRRLVEQKGLQVKTGIIVCKPYMAARAWATAAKQWDDVSWIVCAPPLPFESYCGEDMDAEQEIQLLTGDLQRLWVYAELGYQVPVEVPADVRQAFGRLAKAGFNRYSIPEAGTGLVIR